jgi:hypothetical protein
MELVDSAASELRLRCTRSEFEALEDAEETHFLPGASGGWGYDGVRLSLTKDEVRDLPPVDLDDHE